MNCHLICIALTCCRFSNLSVTVKHLWRNLSSLWNPLLEQKFLWRQSGLVKGSMIWLDLLRTNLNPIKLSLFIATCLQEDCSSLGSEGIIKFLTGDVRRSKTRSNDIFWEAVWPRLLAKGWHSEQPKDVSTTKNCLVFLVPGIKKFSRSKLTKGIHYFDSVSDALKMVAADPVLLRVWGWCGRPWFNCWEKWRYSRNETEPRQPFRWISGAS